MLNSMLNSSGEKKKKKVCSWLLWKGFLLFQKKKSHPSLDSEYFSENFQKVLFSSMLPTEKKCQELMTLA